MNITCTSLLNYTSMYNRVYTQSLRVFLLLKSFFSVPKVEGESETVEKGEPAEQEEISQQPDGMSAAQLACIQHYFCYRQLV